MHLPLAAIDPRALIRDRTHLDETALQTLTTSILTEGLRMPVEVWRLTTPRDGHTHGLISGLRRFTAHQRLAATDPRFGQIEATLRTPRDLPAAMAAMVSENEVRAQITPWEKGLLITRTVDQSLFDTLDAAVNGLYPALPRQARARLRGYAQVASTLEGLLSDPESLPATRMERLAALLRAGMEDAVIDTLDPLRKSSPESQWHALRPLLSEPVEDETTPGRPRRSLTLPQGLTVRREKTSTGWVLRFSGPEARRGGFVDDVLDKVEEWFG